MVSHAADPIRLATSVPRNGRQIRMQFEARVRIKKWSALLGAEDDVELFVTWGVAPGWDGDAPLARRLIAIGRMQTSALPRINSGFMVLAWPPC